MSDKNGTGPRKGSYMREVLRRKGKKAGHKQGTC